MGFRIESAMRLGCSWSGTERGDARMRGASSALTQGGWLRAILFSYDVSAAEGLRKLRVTNCRFRLDVSNHETVSWKLDYMIN